MKLSEHKATWIAGSFLAIGALLGVLSPSAAVAADPSMPTAVVETQRADQCPKYLGQLQQMGPNAGRLVCRRLYR